MLCEPAPSLTDLALGLVTLGLAMTLQSRPGVHRYWRLTFWWTAAAALAGAVHHGVVTCSDTLGRPELGGHQRDGRPRGLVPARRDRRWRCSAPAGAGVFWLLRSGGLVAYAVLALTGRAGIGAILLCEGLTMIAILALWGYAAAPREPAGVARHHRAGGERRWPRSPRALPSGATELVGLDPTSLYHLAQIPGLVLLAWAAAGARPRDGDAPRPIRPRTSPRRR